MFLIFFIHMNPGLHGWMNQMRNQMKNPISEAVTTRALNISMVNPGFLCILPRFKPNNSNSNINNNSPIECGIAFLFA